MDLILASSIQPARPRISPAVATLTLLIALNLLNYIDPLLLCNCETVKELSFLRVITLFVQWASSRPV